jgi:hypothetical protein
VAACRVSFFVEYPLIPVWARMLGTEAEMPKQFGAKSSFDPMALATSTGTCLCESQQPAVYYDIT